MMKRTKSKQERVIQFGRMDASNPKEEEWLTYVERLEMFFVLNNVPEDNNAARLLTLKGPSQSPPFSMTSKLLI